LKKKYTERLAELAGIDIEAPDEPSDSLGAPEAGKNMHCYAEIKYAEYLKSGKDLDWLATPEQPFVALNNPCEVSDSDGLEIPPEGQDIGDYVKSAKEFTWIVHERHKEAMGDEYFFYLDKLTFCKDDSDAPDCEKIIHYSANWNGNKKGTRAHNFLGEDFVFSKNDAVGFCLENSKAKICLSPLKSN
jgi:hypothetical protein